MGSKAAEFRGFSSYLKAIVCLVSALKRFAMLLMLIRAFLSSSSSPVPHKALIASHLGRDRYGGKRGHRNPAQQGMSPDWSAKWTLKGTLPEILHSQHHLGLLAVVG